MSSLPPFSTTQSDGELASLLDTLKGLQQHLLREEAKQQRSIDQVHPNYTASAKNLVHYLALRQLDLSELQHQLAQLGLSSLGRSEAHVMATLNAVTSRVAEHLGVAVNSQGGFTSYNVGNQKLEDNTQRLFGTKPNERDTRVMVTMPTEAAEGPELIASLLMAGMNCIRINCAHDNANTWGKMADNLRLAKQALASQSASAPECKIAMDLGGPKIRTGAITPGPAVIKVSPKRDKFGGVLAPAQIWLSASAHATTDYTRPEREPCAHVLVPHHWLQEVQALAGKAKEPKFGKITLVDSRGADRRLTVTSIAPDGIWVECFNTVYFTNGTFLNYMQHGERLCIGELTDIPPLEQNVVVHKSDALWLLPAGEVGAPAQYANGRCIREAGVSCSLAGVLNMVRTGEPIWFDDGKIGGVFEEVSPERALIRITHASANGSKIRSDKGINLPQSQLMLGALTSKDIRDLAFAANEADIVNLSFVNSPSDISELYAHLDIHTQGREEKPAVVLKIETQKAFENLPALLLTAMRYPNTGVMIARGDLAVECGFTRLAELQEEILCMCEAAHIPVIWATQVLESLAKKGLASRAEISDASLGHRAECIMLNKGPHIQSAVQTLVAILRRMQAHQRKKASVLSQLQVAKGFAGRLDEELRETS